MIKFVIGIFFVLHGLVHLLYLGQSQRRFELQPGMLWPDGSWAFSKLLGDAAARSLASVACALAASGFAAGGVGLLLELDWWRPAVVGSAVFSAVIYVLFWNGKMSRLSDQGALAILINAAILVAVLVLRWPNL